MYMHIYGQCIHGSVSINQSKEKLHETKLGESPLLGLQRRPHLPGSARPSTLAFLAVALAQPLVLAFALAQFPPGAFLFAAGGLAAARGRA
jgi:hypothetical protein